MRTEGSSSSTSQGRVLNPCARESKARIGRLLREKLISDHALQTNMELQTGKIRETFSGMHGALDEWMLACAPASSAQDLHHRGPRYFSFPYFYVMCGFEKLGLVDQNCLGCDLSALLLRTLAVGRPQQSESIEVALDME